MADAAGAPSVGRPAPLRLGDKVTALRDPASYPDRPARVETIETHFAWVFLTGRHAYKLKKPLRLKGADLRTLAARERNCREELRLNRRLAPDTYLRIVPLTLAGGRLAVGGSGTVQDWLVMMRQLPGEAMLDRRLAAGRVTPEDLARVVETLAGFYRGLRPEPLTPAAYLALVRDRLDEALHELARPEFALPPAEVRQLGEILLGGLARERRALGARAAAGRVVEGHGDLRAEHVWLGPPVRIIDALEFERRLRLLDAAEEIAMLMVDLLHLGFADAAGRLREAYREHMPDDVGAGLLAFYLALRAATRAKVAIWHLDDAGSFPDPAPWRQRAREFMRLACDAAAYAG